MMCIRDLFKTSQICISLVAVWLAACTTSQVATSLPTATLIVETSAPVPTATDSISATPDIWQIQKCYKAPSIIDVHTLIWNYTGDIEGHGQADVLLNFTEDNEIQGFLFDFEQVREYSINGCVINRDFIMWLQQGETIEAIIQGEFPETDPRGYYPSTKTLSFDIITGSLMKRGSSQSNDVYLRLLSGNGGTMQHRFELEGVKNDTVILNASQQFLAAVINDDRSLVIDMIRFPIEVSLRGETNKIETSESFLANYNAIFGDGFKERLAVTFPNYLIAYSGNFGGIGLTVYGGGSIIFDGQGRITAIYNWETPVAAPTAAP